MAGTFELFEDEDACYRFRLVGPDGRTVAESGAFPDKGAAVAGINAFRECAGTGLIRDACADSQPPAPGPPAPPPPAPRPSSSGS